MSASSLDEQPVYVPYRQSVSPPQAAYEPFPMYGQDACATRIQIRFRSWMRARKDSTLRSIDAFCQKQAAARTVQTTWRQKLQAESQLAIDRIELIGGCLLRELDHKEKMVLTTASLVAEAFAAADAHHSEQSRQLGELSGGEAQSSIMVDKQHASALQEAVQRGVR